MGMMEPRQVPPVTTIPPFTNTAVLPACAISCGPLFDANGACVPPAAPAADANAYDKCFCSHNGVAPFSTATTGVCDAVCGADGLASIGNWFKSLCDVKNDNNGGVTTTTEGGQTTTTGGSSSGDSSGSNGSGSGGGGDWLSNHWQWVVMLVVLVVGITGIWIGACIWRRRYLKKKDRQSTIGQKQSGSATHPSWGPGFADPPPNLGNNRSSIAPTPPSDDPRTKGSFMPGAAAAAVEEGEKKSKLKWLSKSRT